MESLLAVDEEALVACGVSRPCAEEMVAHAIEFLGEERLVVPEGYRLQPPWKQGAVAFES